MFLSGLAHPALYNEEPQIKVMLNPEEKKTTPSAPAQWSDVLQAPSTERADPRIRTIAAIEHAVISCAESLGRAFDYLKEVESKPKDADMSLRAALHALTDSQQALKPIQRLTATSPEQMRELSTCVSETSAALGRLIDMSKDALQTSLDVTRRHKVHEIMAACPLITDGLENALVIPLKVTKKEMIGETHTPQSLTA